MSHRLWTAIVPSRHETRILMLNGETPLLKARLSPWPQHLLALSTLLDGLALWQGHKLSAVIGVDGDSPGWVSGQVDLVELDTALYRLELAPLSEARTRDTLTGLGNFRELYRLLAKEAAR